MLWRSLGVVGWCVNYCWLGMFLCIIMWICVVKWCFVLFYWLVIGLGRYWNCIDDVWWFWNVWDGVGWIVWS